MKSTVENLSSIQRKIAVEVEAEKVLASLDDAYRALNRQVRVEGFRPGKTPRHVLERRYRAQVEADVAQMLVESSFGEVVEEKKLDVVSRPEVSRPDLKAGQPLRYEVQIEVRPVLEPKDYTGLTIKRGKHPVGDAEVDAELERIRKNQSTLEAVSGRDLAQKGDYALIDFTALIDGKPFTGNQGENVTVEIAEGDFTAGQVAQVEGMKVGEEKEVDYTFAADYRNPDAAGKLSKLKLKVKELKYRKLPNLDDEFAKDLGAGSTLAELRTKVLEGLTADAKSQRDEETRKSVIESLISKNPFDCPKAMVDRAVVSMLRGMISRLAQQGINAEQLGLDFNQLGNDARGRAEEEVRGSLLLEAIADKEKIQPSKEDQEKRIAEMAAESNTTVAAVEKSLRDAERKGIFEQALRERMTLSFLESKGTIEEIQPEAPKAS